MYSQLHGFVRGIAILAVEHSAVLALRCGFKTYLGDHLPNHCCTNVRRKAAGYLARCFALLRLKRRLGSFGSLAPFACIVLTEQADFTIYFAECSARGFKGLFRALVDDLL